MTAQGVLLVFNATLLGGLFGFGFGFGVWSMTGLIKKLEEGRQSDAPRRPRWSVTGFNRKDDTA